MKNDVTNIFKEWSANDINEIRKNVISDILATDANEHFVYMKNFEKMLEDGVNKECINNNFVIFLLEEKDVLLLAGIIIHTADFSGNA